MPRVILVQVAYGPHFKKHCPENKMIVSALKIFCKLKPPYWSCMAEIFGVLIKLFSKEYIQPYSCCSRFAAMNWPCLLQECKSGSSVPIRLLDNGRLLFSPWPNTYLQSRELGIWLWRADIWEKRDSSLLSSLRFSPPLPSFSMTPSSTSLKSHLTWSPSMSQNSLHQEMSLILHQKRG